MGLAALLCGSHSSGCLRIRDSFIDQQRLPAQHYAVPTASAASPPACWPAQVLRAFEWGTGLDPAAGRRQYKFDVLITTYEMVIKDSYVLRPIK